MSPLTRWTGPTSPLRARMADDSPPAPPAPDPATQVELPPPSGLLLAERPTEPLDRQELAGLVEPMVEPMAAPVIATVIAPVAAPVAASVTATVTDRPAPAPGSRMARKALRARAAEQRRRRLLQTGTRFAVPILLVVVLVIVAAVVLGARGSRSSSDGAAARTQQTMLLQVSGPGSLATADVLLARSTSNSTASGVLIPGDLVTDAASLGAVPFGQTARIADPTTAGNAISDQLGVIVDGVWRLDANGLAALVDAVGGVTVDVAGDVTDSQGNVVVPAGPGRKLDGRSAAAYAGFRGPRDPEQARAARFSDVFSAFLKQLPTDQAQVQAVVVKAGNDAVATWNPAQVADFLAGLAGSVRTGDLILTNLPVKVIDTGSATPSFRLDRDAASALVDQAFADSKPQGRPGGDVRVLVENGVGTPGLGDRARAKLVASGFVFVNGGNAAKFGRGATVVVVPDSSSNSLQQGADVAKTLGLPSTAVQVSGEGQSVADLIVILGKDFSG